MKTLIDYLGGLTVSQGRLAGQLFEVCLLFIHPRTPNLISLRSAGDGQSESHSKGRWSPSLLPSTRCLSPIRSGWLRDFAPAYTSTPE